MKRVISRDILKLLLLLAAVPLSHASPTPGGNPLYATRVWRTQDGLPENRIRAIAQTPDGYLWIGTSSGLARFDGARFVVLSRFNTPSMRDDNIRALSVARDGGLWAATDGGGVLYYRNGAFQSFGPNEGLANEFVGAVLEDRAGDVWAATNRGLFRRHSRRFERVDEELRLSNIAFFALRETAEGVLAGGPSGLFLVKEGHLRPYGGKELDGVYHIGETRDGRVWLGTSHGLRIVGGSESNNRPAFAETMLPAILQDRAGNMWIGTGGAGLHLLRPEGNAAFRAPDSLPDNSVAAILEDREGNVWVGTADGLVRLSAPEVALVNARNGLSDDNVSTVYCGPRGGVWITTAAGKAFRYGAAAEPLVLPREVSALRLRSTIVDSSGALWFGTDNQGVVRLQNGAVTRFTVQEGLRNNGIQALLEDRQGRLWIGTTSGLSRWDGARFTNFYTQDGLTYGWVRTIALDPNGDILVGTDRGLNRIHDSQFVTDLSFAPLARDRVWALYSSSPDTLWVGTRGGGLARIRNGKVSRITTRQGMLSDAIFQVIGDAAGRLWLSGPQGLSSASLADLNAVADGQSDTAAVRSYGAGDGLDSTQMNGGVQPAGCMAETGELWFPSVKGAAHFKPGLRRQGEAAPVQIESLTVDDRTVPASPEILIGPGRRAIRIDFTACVLRSPEQVSFQYRLEGFDDRWITASGRRSASYDNLPPGRYRFRVVVHDGTLDNAGSSETGFWVVAQPHLYQTPWFYALAAALAGACIWAGIWFQDRQARARYNLRLAERTRIAREMHDTVVQGCVGVSTLIEAAVGSARHDHDLMLECLDNARIHLRLTLDEARQALSDLRHDSFENGLTGALSELARTMSSDRGARVTLEVAGVPRPLPDSINRTLLLVAREAIRNALTHGAPALVLVKVAYEAEAIRIEVEDDGCGFEPASTGLAEAGHFGILGMRERMEQIAGAFEVLSRPGRGATVMALLPLDRDH